MASPTAVRDLEGKVALVTRQRMLHNKARFRVLLTTADSGYGFTNPSHESLEEKP